MDSENSPDLSRRAFLGALTSGAILHRSRLHAELQSGPGLSLPPFLARPTTTSIQLHVRNGTVDATHRLEFREIGVNEWRADGPNRTVRAGEFITWRIGGLESNTQYEYRLLAAAGRADLTPMTRGRFTTQRKGEESFVAAVITDAHAGSFTDPSWPLEVLDDVVRNVRSDEPEFVIGLGDNVAWHTSRDFPQDDERGAVRSYETYRRHLGPLSASCPHFGLIGNWEGESGKFSAESTSLVREVRRRFTPNPDHRTYPEGGSPREDYYAFDWGPALFVILNVQSYTEPSGDLLDTTHDVSIVADWTLGRAQISWLEDVLSTSNHPFRFVCIHHPVGGNAPTRVETLYGRGGPRAASVGEQQQLHQMMREFGVQVFLYGHDHVFLHEIVDDIHYALPGSCGAPWKFGREVTGYERFWPDSGHARLTVRPDRARIDFVSRAGRVLHRFDVDPNS